MKENYLNSNIKLNRFNGFLSVDHIHLMIQYLPRVSISSIIQKIKQITTFYVWRDERFEVFLRKHFWKEKTFWSDGFFVCSIGEANPETIKAYIENQE